jgi:adenosylmethionine-8-amino-7-oxononanoate aminotransferase
MVFCPPLIIASDQVDELFAKFEKSLNETLDWVSSHRGE